MMDRGLLKFLILVSSVVACPVMLLVSSMELVDVPLQMSKTPFALWAFITDDGRDVFLWTPFVCPSACRA